MDHGVGPETPVHIQKERKLAAPPPRGEQFLQKINVQRQAFGSHAFIGRHVQVCLDHSAELLDEIVKAAADEVAEP